MSHLKTHKDLDYIALTIFIGILSYPFFLIITIGAPIIPYLKAYLKEVIGFGLLSFSFLGILLLITHTLLRKYLFLLFYVLLSFLAFIKLSFYYHYGVKISASALFVIFETHTSEATGFLTNYFDFGVIIILAIVLLPLLFVYKTLFLDRQKKNVIKRILFLSIKNNFIKAAIFFLIPISFFIIFKKFSTQNIVITCFSSYKEYRTTKENLRHNLAQSTSANLVVTSNSSDPQTHIVIIGESTTSWHMQLYDYPRETNPLLSEIKNELIVFDSIISPHTHTILSFEKVFTLSHYSDPDKTENASIVQMANQAGYSTYWLSNQKPVGIHESIPTIIASAAQHKYFMATDSYSSNIYDENLLPKLEEILKDTTVKKVIFVHLIGTHIDYKKRYPAKYNYFTKSPPTKALGDESALKLIDEYDNAVRYNDFIVRSIIEKVRAKNTNSFVAYFSDHGDDVFDVTNAIGHNEYHGTRPMYEVPFLVWFSKKFKTQEPLLWTLGSKFNKRYNLEDFIHSFSDLTKIKFDGYDQTRSLFSSYYQNRTRWIKKNIDYDNQEK